MTPTRRPLLAAAMASFACLAAAGSASAQITFTNPEPATSPAARRSALFVVEPSANGDRLWLWGGYNGTAVRAMARYDTWSNTWTTGIAGANEPAARERMAGAWHPGAKRAVMFGGMDGSLALQNSVSLYDPATNAWSAPTVVGTPPAARMDTTMVYSATRGALLVFGGMGGSLFSPGPWYNDVHQLDLSSDGLTATWTKLTTTGTGPVGRGAACVVLDDASDKLFVFGGHYTKSGGGFGTKLVNRNDAFTLDLASNVWSAEAQSGDIPTSRSFMQCFYASSQGVVLLHGGQDNNDNKLDDTYTYDPTAQAWTLRTPAATVGPLSDAVTLYSPSLDKGILFGGQPQAGVYLFTTWLVDVALNTPPVADAGLPQAVNEAVSVQLDGSASSDGDGDGLSYAWTQTTGLNVTLSAASTATPTFTAPRVHQQETLTFSLTVSDGQAQSTDTVEVTVGDALDDAPVADAGSGFAVNEESSTSLDGTGSYDPDGSALSYQWNQVGEPLVSLSGATTATPGFTAPSVGLATTLTFSLVVHDGVKSSAAALVDVVVNNVINDAPVASAGGDQQVDEATAVTLDGTASDDPNDDSLTYQWLQLPGGPTVQLSDATAPRPTFLAPSVVRDDVSLSFQLIVSDGSLDSDPDVVVIALSNTVNEPPVAHAGTDGTVTEGVPYFLDGSGSSDPNGEALTYSWTQQGGSSVVLSDADTAAPSFQAPSVEGTPEVLVFVLTVTDPNLASDSASVTITINDAGNSVPVASASANTPVDEGELVTLDGSASTDADGDLLSYDWLQTAGPTIVLDDATAEAPTFPAPTVFTATDLTFRLVVHDGIVSSSAATVTVRVNDSVNESPLAVAGADQTRGELVGVTLDGTGSSDPNGDLLSFSWTQVSGPPVTLSGTDTATPSFTTPTVLAGSVIELALVVNDGASSSAPDVVQVTVQNNRNERPVADASADQTVASGAAVTLDGSASYDPNGSALSYQWTQTSGPAVLLGDDTLAQPSFVAPFSLSDETFVFELVVHDGVDASIADEVFVTASTSFGPPVLVSLPRNMGITGVPWLYDGDGVAAALGATPLLWSLAEAPAGMIVDAETGAITWTPTSAGAATVRLAVENAAGSDEHSFIVDVYERPTITSTPNLNFAIGRPYQYDDDGIPSATGTPPIFWEIESAAFNPVMNRTTGELILVPISQYPIDVTIRAHNAFGSDEQTFTITRPGVSPEIVREANLVAMAGVPYQYSVDNVVRVLNAGEGEHLLVGTAPPTPNDVRVLSNRLHWIPRAPGVVTVSLSLLGTNSVFLDEYTFDVEVVSNPGDKPTAVAVVTPTSGSAPLTAYGDGGESTGALGQNILLYAWDMGDGSASISGDSALASYTYTQAGGYNVRLTVVDAFGTRADDKVYVAVADGDNQPPTAGIITDFAEGREQLTVELSCNCADPDGTISAVLWEYGDGDSSFEPDARHTYLEPGSYRVRLTVWDDEGLVGTDTETIEVMAGDLHPPEVRIYATPAEGDSPMRVEFGADVYDEDGTVASYRWIMPDGTTRTDAQFEEVFAAGGYYPVQLEVVDDDGLVGRDQLTLAVRADGVRPPRIVSAPERVALVDVPYQYDDDGLPAAQGGRPLVWRLGKRVDDVIVNKPDGMEVELETGRVTWTPVEDQVGRHRVTLIAENAAGSWVQDFEVDVLGGEASPATSADGCACSQGSTRKDTLLWVALLLGLSRARGRRRLKARCGAGPHVTLACAVLGCLLLAVPAAAAPVITSTPITTARQTERWRYDADGVPSAAGTGALSWSITSGPVGMYVDSVSGELLWIPAEPGTVDVVLRVEDASGSDEQAFSVSVSGGQLPQLLFDPPEGGFVVEAGKVENLGTETLAVPLAGTPPITTWLGSTSDDGISQARCLQVTTANLYVALYPYEHTCEVEIFAANEWGVDSQRFTIHFIPPADETGSAYLQPRFTPDTTIGDAALSVSFDASETLIPPPEDGWTVQGVWFFGDGYTQLFEGFPPSVSHVYVLPGTYEASLFIIASRLTEDIQTPVGLQSTWVVPIVVTEDALRPPEPQLFAEPETGEAPLTVSFRSETVQGDGFLVDYELDYGDGDRFAPVVTFPFEDYETVHVYGEPGWYIARLTEVARVPDPDAPDQPLELRAVVERDIIVTDEGRIPPYARGSAVPSRGDVPLRVTLTGEVGDLDGYVLSRHWVLPDGGISFEELPSLTFETPGEHVVTLVVRDDHGLESQSIVRIAATKDGVLPPRIVSLPDRAAIVGQPWRYDDDSTPTVVGGGPYSWSVGKVIDGQRLNVPAGFGIDPSTGAITWTPSERHAGDVPVSLLVENVAGVALQDFVVSVSPRPGTVARPQDPGSVAAPQQCGCATSKAEPGPAPFAFLAALVLLGRKRRAGRGTL